MSDAIDDRLMSSSSPEPGNAAPAATVRNTHGQKTSGDGDQNESRPWSHSLQSKSTSLLTQALAVHKEAVGTTLNEHSAHNPLQLATNCLLPLGLLPDDQTNNGVSTPVDAEAETNQMGEVAPASSGGRVGAVSRGSTPASSTFNLPRVAQVNIVLTSPHTLLNGSRPRGTSLERTEKEKKVEGSSKGTFSTNPGDTALPPSPDPESPITLDSNDPPTGGVRARYRSWRDVKPNMASEKAWSIGEQGSASSHGQVERSINEAMTGAEHNNRSRKASHTLGFFKEGLPEDKSKKKESKSRARSTEESSPGKGVVGSDTGKHRAGQTPVLESCHPYDSDVRDCTSPVQPPLDLLAVTSHGSKPTIGLAAQEGYFDASHSIETVSEEQVQSMPPQLLADIRMHHNLTPGAAKGSSFSQSMPLTASERPQSDSGEELSNPSKAAESKSRTHSQEDSADLTGIKSNDEDEESGEEQISSALFVPHHTRFEYSEESSHVLESVVGPRPTGPRRDTSTSQLWLEEHRMSPGEVEKKSTGRDEFSRLLPVTPSSLQKEKRQQSEKELLSPFSETHEADYAVPEDESITTEEALGVEDSIDTTPVGSFKLGNQIPIDYTQYFHDHQINPKQPLEAIELIPYRHQVGGHTTLWRFSKRAVAKQLSNRENEFYEKVERHHPQLLKFLPRYIGVLNVTFEKQSRRKSGRKDDADEATERQDIATDRPNDQNDEESAVSPTAKAHVFVSGHGDQPRMVSQSIAFSAVPRPTVTFADNRHIIPQSFMQRHPRFMNAGHGSKSNDAAILSKHVETPRTSSDFRDVKERPQLSDKHAASWGATTVNKQLRNQVFGEAFLQQPIPIQRHKKPASQHRLLPSRHNESNLRTSNSESSLKAAQQDLVGLNTNPPEESIRRKAIKAAAERRNGPAQMKATETKQSINALNGDEAQTEGDGKTGTSAPEPEIAHAPQGKRQRRYSSGGLRRKPAEVAEDRGNLKYFEEADDAGYKGDIEEDVFPMDLDPSQNLTAPLAFSLSDLGPSVESARKKSISSAVQGPTKDKSKAVSPIAVREPSSDLLDIPRPVNPKEAQTKRDSRVVYFLLLEDLTAGMKRPCIMDLKMGTRQYGVDANEKKQKSQRRKSEATTSRELGVRVCGLQVWDAKTEDYLFLDKYYGRDLKSGRQFQDALMRFLYDGVDYSSVLRHIPSILAKLSKLEVLIQGLVGYRFYAASLLMFYDGDPKDADESDSTATERDAKSQNEVDFKIADFANSVAKEDFHLGEKPCPPLHPDQPDRGFLRGLRSLKKYFLAIQREIQAREMRKRREDILRDGYDGSVSNAWDLEGGGISY